MLLFILTIKVYGLLPLLSSRIFTKATSHAKFGDRKQGMLAFSRLMDSNFIGRQPVSERTSFVSLHGFPCKVKDRKQGMPAFPVLPLHQTCSPGQSCTEP